MARQYVKCSGERAFVLLQTLNPVRFMGCDSPVFKWFKHWLSLGWRTWRWKHCWRDNADGRKQRV